MPKKKDVKTPGEALTPQELGKRISERRKKEVADLRRLAENFKVGTRVNRSMKRSMKVWDNADPALLVEVQITGTVVESIISIESGYPTIFVLWDGDTLPIPEHPNVISIDW